MRNQHHHQQGSPPGGEQHPTPANTIQQRVIQRFAAQAGAWQDRYQASDLPSRIYQRRHARALGLVDQLGLPAGSPALEIGPGAGHTTVALARRGLQVTAIDATPTLLELTRRQVEAADLPGTGRVGLLLGDTHHLPVADAHVDVVVALGVLPWLHTPAQAIAELARVLRPGGHLVVSADNHARLTHRLDPWRNPALRPLQQAVKARAGAMGWWQRRDHGFGVAATYHRIGEVDRLLRVAGLERRGGVTLGFGPLTLGGRRVLPQRLGLWMDRRLQRLADHGVPWLRSAGDHYLVMARKPQPPSNPARETRAAPSAVAGRCSQGWRQAGKGQP